MTTPSNDRPGQTLSIIVPFYNERATLSEIAERVLAVDLPYTDKQLILVDDGSTDGSSDIARQLAASHPHSIQSIRLPANSGKGAAVRRGLSAATGDLIVIQDADLEYNPQDLARIVATFADPQVTVVYGSRRLDSTNPQGQALFRWGGRFITELTNLLFGSALTDQPTGYKCARRGAIQQLELSSNGFEFCAELTVRLLLGGHRIVEIPISYAPRSLSDGKKIRLRDGARIAWTLFRLKFSNSTTSPKATSPIRRSLETRSSGNLPDRTAGTHAGNVGYESASPALEIPASPIRWSASHWSDRLLVLLLLVLTFLLACFGNQDMDIWWHLKAGRAILDGQGIPDRDTYTVAGAGNDWIDLHWLFQSAVAVLHRWGGSEVLTVAAAVLAIMAVGWGVAGSGTNGARPYVAILWLPAILVMSSRFYIRPEMLTLVCMAAYLCLLQGAERRARLLWWLIPWQILWVNVQGLFCFGPFLLGCWLIDRWLHSDRAQRRDLFRECGPPALLMGLACLANPYGWRGAVYPVALAKTMFVDGSFFRRHIAELASPLSVWQATAYRSLYIWAAFALFLMAAGSFLIPGVRIRFYRLCIFAVFSGLGLTAHRNLPQFALIAAWILTQNVAEGAAWLKAAERFVPAIRLTSLALVIAAIAVVPDNQFYQLLGSSRTFGFSESPLWHAHDAARFVSGDGMPPVVLAFHEGQAALVEYYMLDQQRVFADARLEVMGRPAMENYYRLADEIALGADGWQDRISPTGSPVAILVDHISHYQLEATIMSDPRWDCAWFGPVAAVYVRSDDDSAERAPSGDLVRRHFGAEHLGVDAPSAAPGPLRDGLNDRLMEASALLNIALAAGQRSTQAGVDRRLLLLLARRLTEQAESQLPAPAWRINSQVAFQMYATPTTKPDQWQLLELLGPARSRFLLRRCRSLVSEDLGPLLDEYAVATAVDDPDAMSLLSVQVAAGRPRTAQQVRLQALVLQNMNAAFVRSMHDPSITFDPAADVNGQIRALYSARRFERIKAEFAAPVSDGAAATEVTPETADLIARACLLCGDPEAARNLWVRAEQEEPVLPSDAGIGLTLLVEQEHVQAMERFQRALDRDPGDVQCRLGLVVCYLELGQAARAVSACDALLALPATSEETQSFCRRLREFAVPYADLPAFDASGTVPH